MRYRPAEVTAAILEVALAQSEPEELERRNSRDAATRSQPAVTRTTTTGTTPATSGNRPFAIRETRNTALDVATTDRPT